MSRTLNRKAGSAEAVRKTGLVGEDIVWGYFP